MKQVNVYFVFSNDNGVPYYRTIPNKQLVCVVDGAWHTAVDDDCWNEPIAPVPDNYIINTIDKPKEADDG